MKAQYFIPTVIEKTHFGERAYGYLFASLKDRIVFVGTRIEDGWQMFDCATLFLSRRMRRRI